MVRLKNHFPKFHQAISLDETRKTLIQERVQTFRDFCASDEKVQKIMADEVFIQGSYAQHTIVRPVGEEPKFDVDVVLPVDRTLGASSMRAPSEVTELIRERMARQSNYQRIVKEYPRCIRVEYRGNEGEFHMDIVAASPSNDTEMPHDIANLDGNRWKPSNPKQLIDWVQEVNEKHGKKFTRFMKYLKRWRDLNDAFANVQKPPSLPLMVFAAKHLPGEMQTLHHRAMPRYSNTSAGDDAFFTDTVIIMADCLQHRAGVPPLPNPKCSRENLTDRVDARSFMVFKEQVLKLANRVEAAYNADTVEKTVSRWKAIFGDDFPSAA